MGQLFGVAGVHGGFTLGAQCGNTIEDGALVVVSDDQIDSVDGRQFLGTQLGIAARYGDDGLRILADQSADDVAALLFRVFGHRTAVDYIDVGRFVRSDTGEASGFELPSDGRGLGEVELAAQRVESDFLDVVSHNE